MEKSGQQAEYGRFDRMRQIHTLVRHLLRPEEKPFVLKALGTREHLSFELLDVPDEDEDENLDITPEALTERMINNANYVLQEFLDAWPLLETELRELLTTGIGILQFDEVLHRTLAYAGDGSEAMEVHTLDFTGGTLDGVTFEKIRWRDAKQTAQLYVILHKAVPCTTWINSTTQHPIAKECDALFGPTKDIIDLIDGRFADMAELDSVLLAAAQRTEGFLPEDEVAELLIRVRAVAVLAKERQALTYSEPSLAELDKFLKMLK